MEDCSYSYYKEDRNETAAKDWGNIYLIQYLSLFGRLRTLFCLERRWHGAPLSYYLLSFPFEGT